MRRRELEINDLHEIESILNAAFVCRIGLADSSEPYIVPVVLAITKKESIFIQLWQGKKSQY